MSSQGHGSGPPNTKPNWQDDQHARGQSKLLGARMKYRHSLSIGILVGAAFQSGAQQPHESASWFVENLGSPVNTQYSERFSMITEDGLALYFASDRPDAMGEPNDQGRKSWDMYVALRTSVDEPFGEPVNLGPNVNSAYGDHSSAFSDDGHWMYFASDRPGGCGSYDLYVSYREDVTDHLAWGEAEHLGCTVNTEFGEACPFFTTDAQSGRELLYLVRNTVKGWPNFDIYVSEVGESARSLQSPLPVSELNTSEHDGHFEPEHGFIWSTRDGGHGGSDLWLTHMPARGDRWAQPRNLGPSINTPHEETLPSSTADGQLFFPSDRPGGHGGFDIYMAARESP